MRQRPGQRGDSDGGGVSPAQAVKQLSRWVQNGRLSVRLLHGPACRRRRSRAVARSVDRKTLSATMIIEDTEKLELETARARAADHAQALSRLTGVVSSGARPYRRAPC
jgi:hypothetical protein